MVRGMATEIRPPVVPARVVVVDARLEAGRDRRGRPLFALDVTVLTEHRDPFRTRLSVAVPDEALGLVHPGAELPAVLIGEGERAVTELRLDDVVGNGAGAVAHRTDDEGDEGR